MGRVAIAIARNIEEIEISESGEIVGVKNGKLAFQKLLKEYKRINAVAPMLIARFIERIKEEGKEIPEDLPEEVKKWIIHTPE